MVYDRQEGHRGHDRRRLFNDLQGVSLPQDSLLCTFSHIHERYTEHEVTEAEFTSLNPRLQDQMKRTAANNMAQTNPGAAAAAWGSYYTPATQMPDRIRRIGECFNLDLNQTKYFSVDWLRDRVYFEGLSRDDKYAQNRLGFKAPNIFVMELTG